MAAARNAGVRTVPLRSGLRSRCGFTLIELLLALSLCGIVLSAAFGAVHLSWKYRTAGESQVANALLIRGVLQDMTLDLRTTALPPQATPSDETIDASDGVPDAVADAFQQAAQSAEAQMSEVGDVREQLLQWETIDHVRPVHFYGSENFFVLLASAENYRFATSTISGRDAVAAASAAPAHVVWWWNSGSNVRVPFSIRNQQLDERTVLGDADWVGLVRMRLACDARLTQSPSNARGSAITPDTGRWTSVIGDIQRVTFRYSDGDRWNTSWNSHVSHRLPTAVECLLERSNHPTKQRLVMRLPQVPARQTQVTPSNRWVNK
jgi:prepilin-type N-terminal cleavage/methylation domain-containing protein